ncbi:ABC transporter permease [Streptomyces zhihengii]
MKPLHHGLLNARRFARRSFASGLALALCGTLSLAAATVVRGAERSAEATLSTGTGLRQIDLEARTDESTAKRLTPAALTAVAGLPGVRSVEPVVQASFDSGPDESLPPFLLHATSARASVPPPLLERARAEVFPLKGHEVVLPAVGDGQDLSGLLGRTVSISYTKRIGENRGTGVTDRITVVGLYDPSWQIDGPNAAYAATPLVAKWAAAREGVEVERFLGTRGFARATVVTAGPEAVGGVLERLHEQRFHAYAVADRVRELPVLLELFRWGALLMLGLLVVAAAVTGAGMGSGLLRERVHEIGLLRAVGRTRREVAAVFVVEIGATGLAAGAAGALCGAVGGALVVRGLAGMEIFAGHLPAGPVLPGPWAVAATLLLPVAAVLTGAARPLRRAVRTDPTRALRDW